MSYTISEIAEKLGLTASTLRFYDKEGLLPNIDRTASGIRVFSDIDLEWLSMVECLKATGMPIKDIKTFLDWCMEGDTTLRERCDMFHERKRVVETQINELQKTLDTINYKCWYYDAAVAAGTADVHKCMLQEEIPEEIRKLKERSISK
ncbi:MerR family transcriptional regulator [Papillibacter cinnamivorans]|uniref:DNA-binding transcriptional regulator, MerR family n=1 Tax=Papillibacter cinnamivorans DSM 12816 TaxID=1122930 RepID=A0A1W2AQH4_9FIRM|nr:MerR family transcriptional regulator [Papillibacter cinnamivorans]SMC62790.1 DNA-binding transcriptional regulator, MerR family [Papillibacter cinnamivorans DSM 12816]